MYVTNILYIKTDCTIALKIKITVKKYFVSVKRCYSL